MKALIFDCDGVLVDTERDGHRVAFNQAFAKKGCGAQWDVPTYGELLKISGGKERMRFFFDRHGWPQEAADRDSYIKDLHRLKTDLFREIIAGGQMSLRPGVARLVDEAIAAGILLAVCSTSNERAVNLIVEKLLGPARKAKFAAILAGDVVKKKKPDPEIYSLARDRLDLNPRECLVVEDSQNGLLSAKAAGMRCVITKSSYTHEEDFTGAEAVYDELGDPPGPFVSLEDLRTLLK